MSERCDLCTVSYIHVNFLKGILSSLRTALLDMLHRFLGAPDSLYTTDHTHAKNKA
jgi:hypothetical protein